MIHFPPLSFSAVLFSIFVSIPSPYAQQHLFRQLTYFSSHIIHFPLFFFFFFFFCFGLPVFAFVSFIRLIHKFLPTQMFGTVVQIRQHYKEIQLKSLLLSAENQKKNVSYFNLKVLCTFVSKLRSVLCYCKMKFYTGWAIRITYYYYVL